MQADDERTYYEARAELQLRLAAATANPAVCASHYALANLYLELAGKAEERLSEAA